jgi:hypothetical protein
LQVKEHSHSFVYEFQNCMFSRSTKIEWICTNIKRAWNMCFTAHVLFLALNVFFSRTTLPLAIWIIIFIPVMMKDYGQVIPVLPLRWGQIAIQRG